MKGLFAETLGIVALTALARGTSCWLRRPARSHSRDGAGRRELRASAQN